MDLTQLPTAFLVFDDALRPLSASRKGLSMFGLRLRRDDNVSDRLPDLAIAIAEAGFTEPLSVAAGHLTRAGAETDFQWEWEDRIYVVRASRLVDEGGIGVVIENVTQQVRYEQTRETARRFLEDILNNVQLGVIVLNDEMRVTTMNNAQEHFLHRLGVFSSWVESVGTPVSELLTDEAQSGTRLRNGWLSGAKRSNIPGRASRRMMANSCCRALSRRCEMRQARWWARFKCRRM